MTPKKRWLVWLSLMTTLLVALPASAQQIQPFRVVGYYLSYNVYGAQPTDLNYPLTDVPVSLLTHLNYAYIEADDNGQCAVDDEFAATELQYPGDTSRQRVAGNFNQLQIINEANPGLTLMMTIGGWDGSERLSQIAGDQELRERFVQSCIVFMRNNGFEGIDLDWRYPVDGGQFPGSPADVENFVTLVQEFRFQLDFRAALDERNYTLSATIPAFRNLLENYDLQTIAPDVDFFNVTTYGFYGSWSTRTGHMAALAYNEQTFGESEDAARLTVDGTVNALLNRGILANQIVIGTPFFGQAWQGVRPNEYFGLNAEHAGVPTGTRNDITGELYYRDLIRFQNNSNWTRFFDQEAGAPWLWDSAARIGISYESVESVRNKANYVRLRDLGGMMVWQLAYDDPQHSLLREIVRVLNDI